MIREPYCQYNEKDQSICKDKMEFIDFQPEVDDSDNDNLELDFVENDEGKCLVDDSQEESGISSDFYRKFHNQSLEIRDVVDDRGDKNCKLDIRDLKHEMYWEIDWSFVEFDKYDGYEKAAEKCEKSLCTFNISSDPKDSFLDAVSFGLVFKLSKNSVINEEIISKC